MKILHLTLKKHWFDEILSGRKKVEYREIKPFWEVRLVGKKYDVIQFRNGYESDSPTMQVEYLGLFRAICGETELYALRLGKLIWSRH